MSNSFNLAEVNLPDAIKFNLESLDCSIKEFKATFNNLLIGLNIEANLESSIGLTGNLIL